MLIKNISKFARGVRRDGWRTATRKAVSYARSAMPAVPLGPLGSLGKKDVIGHYKFILGEEQGFGLKITPTNVPEGSMTWVVPDFNANSGGHINILRMMRLLKERGFPNQHLVVMEPHRWSSVEEAQASLNDSFGDYGITVSLGARSIEPCHYLVATGWQTAYWVAKYRDTIHRLYFVQDFEPAFYSSGSDSALAEETYKLGLVGITAGTWLAEKLSKEYGMMTLAYSFACDTDLYKARPKRPSKTRHIFFYARPVTPRRCFELGLLALERVCAQMPDAAVIFAGWDVSSYEIPFHHLNAGSVTLAELPDLYSQCDVALILSSTNLSLLPLEVAACGCPLVMNDGPQANWLLSEDEAFYCDMNVDAIAATLMRVLNDSQSASKRAHAAANRAATSDWGAEANKIAGFLSAL
jgi:glycosyltransferase involved in cell wall biosynthesis